MTPSPTRWNLAIPVLALGLALALGAAAPALAQQPDSNPPPTDQGPPPERETGPMPPAPPPQAQQPREPVQEQNPPDAPADNSGQTAPGAAAGPMGAHPVTDTPIAKAPDASKLPELKPTVTPGTKIQVPTGTHIPLVLHNGISTRSTRPGDPVYFETLFPVMIDGKVVIPAGSFVGGEVTESKRPGRVKGKGELMIKLNTMILPNGYMVNLNATPSNADTGGGESTDNEGKIIGDSDKTTDAGTIAKTTAAGAGIGGLATRTGAGAGIGAGIGAAAGLMAVLLTRGPEAEMPRGTTVEVTLNRPIFLDAEKAQFTGPGQASTLAGPPNREPTRSRSPF
jgi:hypothetical protein